MVVTGSDSDRKCGAYIVLPPGHGKSYLHGKITGLYEADSLFNCKGNELLTHLRDTAKLTGEWEVYDKAWTLEVKTHMPPDIQVIMVPDDSVGKLLAHKRIFHGVLSISQWEQNLSGRKGSVEKYFDWWMKVYDMGGRVYRTNSELEEAIRNAVHEATKED